MSVADFGMEAEGGGVLACCGFDSQLSQGARDGIESRTCRTAGRLSLACDLMEPLRVTAVDRWVIHCCNQWHFLDPKRDFQADDEGGIKLTDARFDEVLANWERNWYERDLQVVLDRQVSGYVRQLRELGEHLPRLKKRLERGEV